MIKQFLVKIFFLSFSLLTMSCVCTESQSAGNFPPGSQIILQRGSQQITRVVDASGNIDVPCGDDWQITS